MGNETIERKETTSAGSASTSRVGTNGDGTDEGGAHSYEPEILKVSVKIPKFWKEKPELWFTQVESQFYVGRISSDLRKYHTVVATIESDILNQVSDILLNPPSENMYATLKAKIIERFTDSDHQRLSKLVQEIELGDKKPSQLLREMRDLAGSRMDDDLLKSLWLQRLPSHMRSIISVSTETLSKLTELADKIAEVNEVPQVSTITQRNSHPHIFSSDSSSKFERQMEELSRSVAELKASFLHNRRERSRSRSYHRSDSKAKPAKKEKPTDECWYHRSYGVDAKRCRSPCKHSKSSN